MRHIPPACLLLLALIHLLPLGGVLGSASLQALYGIQVQGPDALILMRHRAVLFGALGGFMAWAAFAPGLRLAAFVLGFASVASFLLIAWSTGGYNGHLSRVVRADILALVALCAGFAGQLRAGRRDPGSPVGGGRA